MPERALVTKELGQLLSVLSHPHRIRIIEELREGELDVATLQVALEISQAGVSQHLGVLRAHRIVEERREGRHVYYHLRQPEMAAWLMGGLRFLEGHRERHNEIVKAMDRVRTLWPDQFA